MWQQLFGFIRIEYLNTAWKGSKHGVLSGPYFPVFGLNTEIYSKSPYSVRIQENTDQKELRVWTIFMQWFVPKTKVEVKTDGHLIVFILVCNVKHDWTDQNNFLVCSRLKLKVLTVLFSNVNVLFIHIEIFIPKSFFSFQWFHKKGCRNLHWGLLD